VHYLFILQRLKAEGASVVPLLHISGPTLGVEWSPYKRGFSEYQMKRNLGLGLPS
jgi:hypothetical protein